MSKMNIKGILQNINKNKKSVLKTLLILLLLVFVFIFFLVPRIEFFSKYGVLLGVEGGDAVYNQVNINSEVVGESEEGWTNLLPIPNSQEYISLINSFGEGRDIGCGKEIIKKAENGNHIENSWCIKHNGNYFVSTTSPNEFWYDEENVIYEKCVKVKYYDSIGTNGCEERGLFLNNKQIASTKEYIKEIDVGERYLAEYLGVPLSDKKIDRLRPAPSFTNYIFKKIKGVVIYQKEEGQKFYIYDITDGTTVVVHEKLPVTDFFLDDNNTIVRIFRQENYDNLEGLGLGYLKYGDNEYTNIIDLDYVDGDFYLLKFDYKRKLSRLVELNADLVKNGGKVDDITINVIRSFFSYDENAINSFPFCDNKTIVCIYEDGHYAYKTKHPLKTDSRSLYDNIMIIDGEWRGDYIPDYIEYSKPIFENGKLRYLVFTKRFHGSLYLVDFEKGWKYESIEYPGLRQFLSYGKYRFLNVIKK